MMSGLRCYECGQPAKYLVKSDSNPPAPSGGGRKRTVCRRGGHVRAVCDQHLGIEVVASVL